MNYTLFRDGHPIEAHATIKAAKSGAQRNAAGERLRTCRYTIADATGDVAESVKVPGERFAWRELASPPSAG